VKGAAPIREALLKFPRAFILAASLATLSSLACASEGVSDLNENVPSLTGRSWLDLLRQAMPDLKAGDPKSDVAATATQVQSMRPMPPSNEPLDPSRPIEIARLATARVEIDGRLRWIVLGEQDSFEAAPLMLFEADGEGKLLDVVDTVGDMHTDLDASGPVALGAGGVVVGVRNWHDNSSESFNQLMLVLVARDRFSLVTETGTYGSRSKDKDESAEASFAVRPDKGRALARIDTLVKQRTQRLAGDFQTPIGKPVVELFRASYRWNAAKGQYQKALEAPPGGRTPETARVAALKKSCAAASPPPACRRRDNRVRRRPARHARGG
jgi:hypothetical protein